MISPRVSCLLHVLGGALITAPRSGPAGPSMGAQAPVVITAGRIRHRHRGWGRAARSELYRKFPSGPLQWVRRVFVKRFV